MLSNNKETPSNVRLSVEQFDHAALVVRDVSASVKWYKDWLGFDSLDRRVDIRHLENPRP